MDLTWGSSPGEQTATEPFLVESGSKWVRMTLNWSDAEPKRGELNAWWLAQYDSAVSIAQAAGQKIIFVVGSSPGWASGSSNTETPPSDPADYAAFIHAMAARYAGRVSAWEVWNEENTARFWSTGPSAAQYAALLKAAYPAVKSADPNALVLFGGTSLNDYRFIAEAYAAGAKGSFDVMAVHPYSCRAPGAVVREADGDITPDSFLGYRMVHSVMLANGDEKPIWFTEVGWSSSTSGACGFGEATQAAYLTEAYKLAEQDPYVQVMCWYNLRNNYWSHDENTLEAQYGLLNTNFTPKPAYTAYKAYTPNIQTNTKPTLTPPEATSPTNGGHHRHGTRTFVSAARSRPSAQAARLAATPRPPGTAARTIRGVVLGASAGQVVVRLYLRSHLTHRWRLVSAVRLSLRAGGRFSMPVRWHMHPRRMRAQVRFPGTGMAAPSVSRYVTFTV